MMPMLLENKLSKRYENILKEKANGETYTPKILADFVAEHIVNSIKQEKLLETLRIFDPAIGDGELLVSIIEKIKKKGCTKIEVFGFETSKQAYMLASQRLLRLFPNVPFHLENSDFLEYVADNYGTEKNI